MSGALKICSERIPVNTIICFFCTPKRNLAETTYLRKILTCFFIRTISTEAPQQQLKFVFILMRTYDIRVKSSGVSTVSSCSVGRPLASEKPKIDQSGM